MSKHTTVPCPEGSPTLLTDGAVTAARVVGSNGFYLCATATSTAPTSTDGAVPMLPCSVLTGDLALGDVFPGVGSSVYLWAWPRSSAADVSISHA